MGFYLYLHIHMNLRIVLKAAGPGLHSEVTTVTAVTDNVPPGCGIREMSLNSERWSIGEHYTSFQ